MISICRENLAHISSLLFVVKTDFPKNGSRVKEGFLSVWRAKSARKNQTKRFFWLEGGYSCSMFFLSLRSIYRQHSKNVLRKGS